MTFEQDVARAADELRRMDGIIANAIPAGVLAGAKYGADQARQRAPRRTGKMADSIEARPGSDKNSAEVYAGVFYSYFVERGTRKPVRGARPFMQPGIYGNRKRIGDIISQAIAEAVEREMR